MKNNLISRAKRAKNLLIKAYKGKTSLSIDNAKVNIKETDKNKVWAFCSGHYSNDFRGNPKYLFIYINKYRKDITAYWLCDDPKIVKQVRKLGYKAYRIGTKQAEEAINKTGVLIHEQVKIVIPEGLENAKYINLWHGVGGIKNVERSVGEGRLLDEIAKKYIKNNSYYRKNEMYLAPSKFIEDIAIDQLGLQKENIIRAGYPRCIYQTRCEKIHSFNSNFIENRDLPKDTKIIAYVPTFRNEKKGDFFTQAIPNVDKLVEICKKNHYLFIFKMHPILEKEMGFLKATEKYKDCKWVMFWDNKYDFYEVISDIDLCIFDFSSIYTDFIALGVKHYIRYLFDNDTLNLNFPMDYDETTLGHKCFSFEELLEYLPNYKEEDLTKKIDKIKKLYWEYSDEKDFDRIIKNIINFKRTESSTKKLYSFDIFDTLISRKVLDPMGIHYYVKEQIEKSDLNYPEYFVKNYPKIRRSAELNVREYYNRTKIERDSLKVEIQFDEIFERMETVYSLNKKQIDFLKKQELKAELDNVIPIPERINEVKELLENGEEVILVSDMYLPEDFIKQMITKADPILGKLDLFLSSSCGYQKADRTLYIEVYKKYGKKYDFLKWIHTGDNPKSDNTMPRKMNIENHRVKPIKFNEYEQDLVDKLQSYDSYLIAASMARFREKHPNMKEQFVYSYIALLFVPYVEWALNNAKKDGDKAVYFVSRDGHQLKRIGEVINEKENLGLNLKYIYASRKTWRVPSFIDQIDIDYWGQGHGNFTEVTTFKKLLKALNLDEKKFDEIFPELENIKDTKKFTTKEIVDLTEVFKASKKYEDYLLNLAKEQRESVCGYLEQEIDKNKQFSIVEYWGRGYTQENFTRLWDHIVGKEVPSKFYYSRSTLPSDKLNIRYNYTVNPAAQQFIESIFAVIDYKSITSYEKVANKWQPVIKHQYCDQILFRSMEEYLPLFAEEYCTLDIQNKDRLGRELIDFAITYYTEKPTWSGFVDILGELEDSVQLYGDITEYAKALTMKDMQLVRFNKVKIGQLTKNPTISVTKSSDKVKNFFYDLYQTEDKDHITTSKKYKRSEIKYSNYCKTELEREKEIATEFYNLYKKECKKNDMYNKVTVLYDENFSTNFKILVDELKKQDNFEVIFIPTTCKKYKYMAKELSESRFIIMAEPYYLLSETKYRENCQTIILSNSALNYFTKGLCKHSPLVSREKLTEYNYNVDVSIIPMPSNGAKELYNKIYSTNVDTEYLPIGSPITDCYFNNEEIKKAKAKANSLLTIGDRKIIGYINYQRYRNQTSQYIQSINLSNMQKELGEEYVVLLINIKNNKVNFVGNNFNIRSFSRDVTKKLSIRELLMASDIIVGDYSDIMLESPLLDKPVFITKWDKDDIEHTKETLLKIEVNPYGKIVRSTDELIDNIKNADESNLEEQTLFKKQYLSNCNGKASKQLVEYIKIKSDN